MRWCGAGIVELSTPDYGEMCYVDASFWSNNGWAAFGVDKPPEYSSLEGLVGHVRDKDPAHVLVALTHDHPDHIADYFETLAGLVDAGVDVKTVVQADLGRTALHDEFVAAGLDPADVIVFGGRGSNIGGVVPYGEMTTWMTPAVHSTRSGHPPVGFVVEIGGVRFYASGDTDLFGDMALIRRFEPDVAMVCVGNGRGTMGPRDAAAAVEMVGAGVAVPIHYGHSPRNRGPDAGPEFADHVAERIPSVDVHVIEPGDILELDFG